jgi:hypothetical protein
VSPVRYEVGFYISEDCILHSHRRGNLKSYTFDIKEDSVFQVCCSFLGVFLQQLTGYS